MSFSKHIRLRPQGIDLRHLFLSVLLAPLVLFFSAQAAFAEEKSVGIIISGDIKYYRDVYNFLMSKLDREGYADKVKLVVQTPYPDSISMSNAVRKLIALNVDVIVTFGAQATLAAYNEKSKIPIVYADVYEPIAARLKGTNITGISSKLPVSSLLRYLRGIVTVKTLGVVYNSEEEDSAFQAKELQKLSVQYGFRAELINLQGNRHAKTVLSNRKFDAIIVTHGCKTGMASGDIEDFARAARIPTASLMPCKNIIIMLYASQKQLGEKAGEKALKILNGIPPENISRTTSSDTELVFNLKEAVMMGIDIPVDLVTEATRIIK